MNRSYYSSPVSTFLKASEEEILGILAARHQFALEDLQKNAWISQVRILKKGLAGFTSGHILFEYTIPRMGKRVDVVIIIGGVVFVLEFKVGESRFTRQALDQVVDYALDLKNFHELSSGAPLVPLLVATEAGSSDDAISSYQDGVFRPLKANKESVGRILADVAATVSVPPIDPLEWEASPYKPTPTIVEAAQALYRGHGVKEITRSDAGAINLAGTSDAISRIIDESKRRGEKSICFVTGVPGAGKTLAGLNIANDRLRVSEDERAVFLSGNGPLVEVLREALARDETASARGTANRLTKSSALTKARAFVQNIHHFRDDALVSDRAPAEKIVIFDEAQRAWSVEQTASFMRKKKGTEGFSMSEPEFLISVMDRHQDWAVILCLVGGGQEINTGEAGLPAWFSAVKKSFPHWRVYASRALSEYEYTRGASIHEMLGPRGLVVDDRLHLSVSVRSYRSERVSHLVKALLDGAHRQAKVLYKEVGVRYPVAVTRDVRKAKGWVRERARGTERYGLLASSGAYRLKPFGIHVQTRVDVRHWFLSGKDDVRSSYFLEDAATEFDIQGLELDWACLAWDADLRYTSGGWEYKKFRGSSWQNINDENRALYLKNAYRVLLTRARQGMIIFVPEGSDGDPTRRRHFYDGTYEHLIGIGFEVI